MLSTIVLLSLVSAAPADDKPYRLDLAGTTQKLKSGAKGDLAIHIEPAAGYHVSGEAPLKITLMGEGLELSKTALSHPDKQDAKAPDPRFKVAFTAKEKGQRTISGEMLFFVCSESLCERKTEKLSVKVDVAP